MSPLLRKSGTPDLGGGGGGGVWAKPIKLWRWNTSPRISGVPEIRFGKPKSGTPDLGRGEVERSEGEGESALRKGRNPSPAALTRVDLSPRER